MRRLTRTMQHHIVLITVACLLWSAVNLHVTYKRVHQAASLPTPTTAPSPTVAREIKQNVKRNVATTVAHVAPHITTHVTPHVARVTSLPLQTPVNDSGVTNQGLARRLPNCLVIGTMDSGAGDMVGYLAMHTHIRVLKGETNFFHRFYERGLEWYRNKMPLSRSDDVTLEMSVRYFDQPEVPERVHAMDSSMKLLVVVLPPVDRTVAHWLRFCRFQYNESMANTVCTNTSTFAGSDVFTPDKQVNRESSLVSRSIYDSSMVRWQRWFPRRHIHIVDGLELRSNPVSALEKVERFLGLEGIISTVHVVYDKRLGVHCIVWNTGTELCLDGYKRFKHPRLTENMSKRLRAYFKPFNEQFNNLVGHNFGWS